MDGDSAVQLRAGRRRCDYGTYVEILLENLERTRVFRISQRVGARPVGPLTTTGALVAIVPCSSLPSFWPYPPSPSQSASFLPSMPMPHRRCRCHQSSGEEFPGSSSSL